LYFTLFSSLLIYSFIVSMAPQSAAIPASVTESVLQSSQPVPEGSHEVSGVDFDQFQGRDITVAEMVDNLAYTGFQGSAVAEAARIINEMVRLSNGVSNSASLRTFSFSAPFVTLKPEPKPPSS
jgi:hypothetical protein